MVETLERVKELKASMAKMQEELTEKAKKAFHEVSQEIFSKYPNLVEFSWNQYTPYFNDGDPCVFGARTDYPWVKFADDNPEDCEDEDRGNEYSSWQLKDKVLNEKEQAANEVLDLLAAFDDHDYEEMFGDHLTVIVTRDGIETEEYSHD